MLQFALKIILGDSIPGFDVLCQTHVQFSKMRPKLAALSSWVSFFQDSFHLEEKGES